MWVKVTDPHTGAKQWVNLDAVGAMKRVIIGKKEPLQMESPAVPRVDHIEVTRLFCAQGTVDCAELPEQVLACSPDAGRHVLPKTVPVVAKPKGRR